MANDDQLVLSISADTRSIQRQLDKLVGSIGGVDQKLGDAFTKVPAKIDNVAKSLGRTRFETANLAAQFQDIAVQLQGGQSPFTVALQQGTQISQVLGQRGATSVVGLLGAAFSSLLSPVSLATIGIIALGGAAVQYGAKALGAIGTLDDELKAHADLIKSLKDAYGEAGKGVDTAVHEAIETIKSLLGLKTDVLKKEFDSLSRSAVRSMSDIIAVTDSIGGSTVIEQTAGKYAKFKDAIDNFRASIAEGTPDVKNFRAAVAQIADSTADEKTRKLAQELLTATDSASKAELAILGTAKAMRNFGAASLDAAEQGEAFSKALKALSTTVSPDLSDREKIMKGYNDALTKAGSTEERLAAARARDDQLAVLGANERKKASEEASKSAESAQKRFQSALDSTSRRTAGIQGEIDALGQGAGAIAKLETQYRLTEQAQQAFGKVTPEVAASIQKVAEAAGNAADQLARAKVASQISFGSQTAFLSSEDLKIAQQLAPIYGNDVPAALNSSYAAAIRLNDALKGVSSSIENDMTSSLTDITTGTKSLKDGFADLTQSIVRDVEQWVIKLAIVGPLLRSLQAGFSSLGLGNILGGGGTGLSLAGTGGFYAIGGYTGPGGKYEPAGVVHRGEYVMDAASTKRLGVPFLDKLRGYADGGPVGLPSIAGASGAAGGNVNVFVQNAPSQPTVTSRKNAGGGRDVMIDFRDAVRSVVNGDLASGQGLARSFKQFSTAGSFRGG